MESETPLVNSVCLVTLKSMDPMASCKTVILWKAVAQLMKRAIFPTMQVTELWDNNRRVFMPAQSVPQNFISTHQCSRVNQSSGLQWSTVSSRAALSDTGYTAARVRGPALPHRHCFHPSTRCLIPHRVCIITEKDKNWLLQKLITTQNFDLTGFPTLLNFKRDPQTTLGTVPLRMIITFYIVWTSTDSSSCILSKQNKSLDLLKLIPKWEKGKTITEPPSSNWERKACATYNSFLEEEAKGPRDLSGFGTLGSSCWGRLGWSRLMWTVSQENTEIWHV